MNTKMTEGKQKMAPAEVSKRMKNRRNRGIAKAVAGGVIGGVLAGPVGVAAGAAAAVAVRRGPVRGKRLSRPATARDKE